MGFEEEFVQEITSLDDQELLTAEYVDELGEKYRGLTFNKTFMWLPLSKRTAEFFFVIVVKLLDPDWKPIIPQRGTPWVYGTHKAYSDRFYEIAQSRWGWSFSQEDK